MKKIIAMLLAAVVLLTVFSCKREEKAAVAAPDAKRVISVASDATWPPMEYVNENREIVGFSIDFIKAVADAAGFEVNIQNTAWDGIFAGLANGNYDVVCSSVTITEERKGTMDFSIPYVNAGQVLIVPKASNAKTLDDMKGKDVGAQIGTTGAFEIQKYQGVSLLTYDEIGLAVADLANGRIGGVVADGPIAADFVLQNEEYKAKLKITGEPFTDEYYGVAVRKGNTEVLNLINTGIQKIIDSGKLEELTEKWLR